MGGNLVVQGPECIQPLLRLLQILLRRLALLERLGVVHVLNRLDPLGIGDPMGY